MFTAQRPVLHGVCAGAARVVPVGVAQRPRPRPVRRQHQTLQSRRGARRGRGGEVGPYHVSRHVTCYVFRSWTGGVIPMRIGKEDITSGRSLGFTLHDRQVQPLCGVIQVGEATYSITV